LAFGPLIPCSPLYSTGPLPSRSVAPRSVPAVLHTGLSGLRRGTAEGAENAEKGNGGGRVGGRFAYSGKRQAKLGGSCQLKVLIMAKGRKPCSRSLSGSGATRTVEAGAGKRASRSVPRTRFGLVTHMGVASPPDSGEASIVREETTDSTERAPRGGRRQRARKEPSGTWETRSSVRPERDGQPGVGSHNHRRGGIAVSDGPIVVRIRRSSRRGAKGPWPGTSRVRGYWS
jgi:hypothetical protein